MWRRAAVAYSGGWLGGDCPSEICRFLCEFANLRALIAYCHFIYLCFFQVDAQRVLLIATERRRALIFERDRLCNLKKLPPLGPLGTVTLANIEVQLHPNFIHTYTQQSESASESYIFFDKSKYFIFRALFVPFHRVDETPRTSSAHSVNHKQTWCKKWFCGIPELYSIAQSSTRFYLFRGSFLLGKFGRPLNFLLTILEDQCSRTDWWRRFNEVEENVYLEKDTSITL